MRPAESCFTVLRSLDCDRRRSSSSMRRVYSLARFRTEDLESGVERYGCDSFSCSKLVLLFDTALIWVFQCGDWVMREEIADNGDAGVCYRCSTVVEHCLLKGAKDNYSKCQHFGGNRSAQGIDCRLPGIKR
jgi:hypothetical protein